MNQPPISLPLLREEIDLLPGPALPDGQPSWTLHDPERNQFFRIDWLTFEILSRWHVGSPALIAERIAQACTLRPDSGDVLSVAKFVEDNQLTIPAGRDASLKLAQRLRDMQGSPGRWLLHNYLFFRVPLLKPDNWLAALLPRVEVLYSRGFRLATLIVLLAGLFQVGRQSELFFTTLVDTFSIRGLMAYAITLVVIKFLHELGHAFTAKRLGCRIPAIGIAFLVLFPMAYTDTNETWRLVNRWQRLQVSCAGILTELIIAAWATMAWAFLPDGQLRSMAFFLATTSWIATVLINASPFLRFDGYFILSDVLDMPNLHSRSFALARWKLREWIFKLNEDKPEHFSPSKERWIIVFAWATWFYRLIVFIGIALLVYHFFVKLLGIFLFVVELWWFIALPIYREIKVWASKREVIMKQSDSRQRSVWSLVLLLAVLSVLLAPWPGKITVSGLLRPAEVWPVIVPTGAMVAEFPYQNNDSVLAGQVVARFYSPELETRLQVAETRAESARWMATSSGLDAATRNQFMVAQQDWATAMAEVSAVREQLQRYQPIAPFSGHLFNIDPDLRLGDWLSANEQLALLVGDAPYIVETYLDEEQISRVAVGDSAVFLSDGTQGGLVRLQVSRIDADATRQLVQGQLTAGAGGHVMTRPQAGAHVPDRAVYRVELTVVEFPAQLNGRHWRGSIVINGRSEAPLSRYARNVMVVLVRELGF